MTNYRPIIGLTMGDAAGIGAEIIAKSLSLPEIYDECRPIAIGDAKAIKHGVDISKLNLTINPVKDVEDAKFIYGIVDVLDMKNIDMSKLVFGKVNAMCGKASVEYVKKAVELALQRKIDAIVSGPLNKEAMNLAGYHYAGQTEILADLTNTRDYAMMLVALDLRVIHVSTHVSIKEAVERVKKKRVLTVIRLANDAIKAIGIQNPRIAISGLNPHAGEGGLFGREEIDEIIPAIQQARSEGIDVTGPFPPDTAFARSRGTYDIVVAMYHDQGHIPIKIVGMVWNAKEQKWTGVTGVNVTLGLPIIRTSVDHGTAYGKAGKGTANPQSMIDAIKLAVELAISRKVGWKSGRSDLVQNKVS